MVIQGKGASRKQPGGLGKVCREVEPIVRDLLFCLFSLAVAHV